MFISVIDYNMYVYIYMYIYLYTLQTMSVRAIGVPLKLLFFTAGIDEETTSIQGNGLDMSSPTKILCIIIYPMLV